MMHDDHAHNVIMYAKGPLSRFHIPIMQYDQVHAVDRPLKKQTLPSKCLHAFVKVPSNTFKACRIAGHQRWTKLLWGGRLVASNYAGNN